MVYTKINIIQAKYPPRDEIFIKNINSTRIQPSLPLEGNFINPIDFISLHKYALGRGLVNKSPEFTTDE